MSELSDFFEEHIFNIRRSNSKCEECGASLRGDYSEICHILPKSKFKSIAMDDDNIIYLCGWQSQNNCHGKLDNSSQSAVKEMKIFPQLQEAFENLEGRITEKINWKDYERFEEL